MEIYDAMSWFQQMKRKFRVFSPLLIRQPLVRDSHPGPGRPFSSHDLAGMRYGVSYGASRFLKCSHELPERVTWCAGGFGGDEIFSLPESFDRDLFSRGSSVFLRCGSSTPFLKLVATLPGLHPPGGRGSVICSETNVRAGNIPHGFGDVAVSESLPDK
jgi:hypothetical protein